MHASTVFLLTLINASLFGAKTINTRKPFVTFEYNDEAFFQDQDRSDIRILARSPGQPPQRPPFSWPADPPNSWPKMTTQQGVMILAGAGERLKANQVKASTEANTAGAKAIAQNVRIENGVVDMVLAETPRGYRVANRKLKQLFSVRMQHLKKMSDAQQTRREKGEDIEHIGLSSKQMRGYMKNKFEPLPNPTQSRDRARALLLKTAGLDGIKEANRLRALGNSKPIFRRKETGAGQRRPVKGPQKYGVAKKRA